jgi:hypothetical protein
MSKETLLPVTIENQLNNKDVKVKFILKIDSVDISDYLISWGLSSDISFGSMSATFVLNNNANIFGDNGASKIEVGDVIEFSEYFEGSSKEFKKFYGKVNQRSFGESATDRTVTIVGLDAISELQFTDIDLEVEGTKIQVVEEVLTPNYLSSPNNTLAQVFNFANNNIADNPLPILVIRNKNTDVEDPQWDGYTVMYENGQVKLGSVLNAKDNYDLVATYSFYVHGVYVEDIIEDILTAADGYGKFMFNESNAQKVIDNHLTTAFYDEMGTTIDTLVPNYTSTNITIYHQLSSAFTAGNSTLTLDSVEGLPTSGEGNVNGDTFTWSSISGTTLQGIPTTGNNSLKNHAISSYFEYTNSYAAGRVWYLYFSNLVTDLVSGDFTIPHDGGGLVYVDKRYGRIIIENAISTQSLITCNRDYFFKTLQASGISLNRISFRSREVENRYEALKKVKEYVAPNFLVRTKGNNKIWANYYSQRVNEDYTLKLATALTFMEDDDLYTRTVFYGKNKNPTNLMYGDGVTFVGTGESYKATATASELTNLREEDNYYVYGSPVSGIGAITVETMKPTIYINEVAIDNTSHVVAGQAIAIEITNTTVTKSGGGK